MDRPDEYGVHAATGKQLAKQEESALPRTFAVPSTRVSGPVRHSLEAETAIAAELVACTLGQRVRPELRVDALAVRLAAIGKQVADAMQAFGRNMAEVHTRVLEAFRVSERVRGDGIEPPTSRV